MRVHASLLALGSLFALSAVGCGAHHGADTSGLDSESSALVDDNNETDDTEGDVESGMEEPLSGIAKAGDPVQISATDVATVAEAARTNPGLFFQPAGCIISTRAANVVTHLFTDCTGPYGLAHFTGTVTSTWTKIPNGWEVTHTAKGFKLNGAQIDHTVTIDYTDVGGVYTKTRKGTTTGTTKNGKPISHTASYVTVVDTNTMCITRNGSSDTTIGAREFSRSISGYERCGLGLGGCPKSGTVTLTRPRLDVKLQFPGGAKVDITVNGREFERALFCNASAG